jgi:hypothetical protein
MYRKVRKEKKSDANGAVERDREVELAHLGGFSLAFAIG